MEQKISKTWNNAQTWEKAWHGNCINSLNEELKQLVYAEKMGLTPNPTNKTPYNFDLKGKSILDLGSGPYSLLLKCTNFSKAAALDPLMGQYPQWVLDRYLTAKIAPYGGTAETPQPANIVYDEVWIYNVLEHTYDPKKIIENALALGKIVRIFEWLDTTKNIGHPQTLTELQLNSWLKGEGKVEYISKNGAVGKCYYGVFKGNNYEKI